MEGVLLLFPGLIAHIALHMLEVQVSVAGVSQTEHGKIVFLCFFRQAFDAIGNLVNRHYQIIGLGNLA